MKKPSLFIMILKTIFRILVVMALMVVIAVGSFEGVTYYLSGEFYDLQKLTQKAEETAEQVTKDQEEKEVSNIDQENTDLTLLFVQSESSYNQYITMQMRNTITNVTDVILFPLHANFSVGKKVLNEVQEKIENAANPIDIVDIERVFGEDSYALITKVIADSLKLKISGYDVMKEKEFLGFIAQAGDINYNLTHPITYRDAKKQLQVIPKGEQFMKPADTWTLLTYADGTESEESNRLQTNAAYLETLIRQLLTRNSAEDIAKSYKAASTSSEGRDLSDLKDIIEGYGEESVIVRIIQGSEKNGMFTIDSDKAALQLSTLIKQANGAQGGSSIAGSDAADKPQIDPNANSRDRSIELYNAAYVSGIAGRWEGYLESEGYHISMLGNYQEEGPLSKTRIIISQEGIGSDLLKYFPDAEISVGTISTGGDIRVLIGTDSTHVPEYTYNDTDEESDDDGSYDFDNDTDYQ